jgi:GTP-binding protein HflX
VITIDNNIPKPEKAVLVGLSADSMEMKERSTEISMEELKALLETAGGESVGYVLQNRPTPDPKSFIGSGKVKEIKELAASNGCSLVVFDNELSPSQMTALNEEIGIKVLDKKRINT